MNKFKNQIKIGLWLMCLMCFALPSLAQNSLGCGTKIDPATYKNELQQNRDYKSAVLPNLNKQLSITAYLTINQQGDTIATEEAIIELIEDTNPYFEPIGLSYKVCEFVYLENYNFSAYNDAAEEDDDEMYKVFNRPNTINMYFVDSLIVDGATAGGVAFFPGGPDVVIIAQQSPQTVAHELGHFFSLYHTFEDMFGEELVNRNDCEDTGDLLCDTDADPYYEQIPFSEITCNLDIDTLDMNGEWFTAPLNNIMSYYESCRCIFTNEQYARMAEAYLTQRNYLW